jgi:hypothetical protein
MREHYLQQQYPNIYRDVPIIHEIIPQDIEVIPEECQEQQLPPRSMATEILTLFMDEPPPVECPICFEDTDFNEINRTKCNHDFCHSCLLLHMASKMTCPLCREHINHIQVKSHEQSDAIVETSRMYYQRLDSDSDYNDMPELIEDEDEDAPIIYNYAIGYHGAIQEN